MRDSKELPTHMGRTLTNKKLHLARSLKTEFLMSTWGMIFILGLQASGISWHQGSTCWLTLAERCRHTHKKTSLLLVFFIFFHCCSERLIFIALRVKVESFFTYVYICKSSEDVQQSARGTWAKLLCSEPFWVDLSPRQSKGDYCRGLRHKVVLG